MSTPSTLAERLAAQTVSDLAVVSAQTQSALQELVMSLQQQCADVLRTTSSDMASQLESLRNQQSTQLQSIQQQFNQLDRLSSRTWLRASLFSLFLVVGVGLGSWGLSKLLSQIIKNQVIELADLKQSIAIQQQTLAAIEKKTWGVIFLEDSKGRFLVLPENTKLDPTWSVGSKPAVRLGTN